MLLTKRFVSLDNDLWRMFIKLEGKLRDKTCDRNVLAPVDECGVSREIKIRNEHNSSRAGTTDFFRTIWGTVATVVCHMMQQKTKQWLGPSQASTWMGGGGGGERDKRMGAISQEGLDRVQSG